MDDLTIRHAAPDDWPAVTELGAQIFQGDQNSAVNHQNARQFWKHIPDDPHFKWENTRIGLLDGQVVAHVSFVERCLRYGQAHLTFGGLFGVCVHPDYRKRGYAAALVRETIHQIEDNGYSLSLLDGIPRFYNRFGYVTLWPSYALKFQASEAQRIAEGSAAGCRVRVASGDDYPAMLVLYEAEWGERPWFVERTPDLLCWRLDCHPCDGVPYVYVVEDADGVVCGYSVGWKIENRTEVLAATPQAVAALLRHTGELLGDQPDTTVSWLDVPDTRAAYYARRWCSVHYHAWVSFRGGWMGRFVHPQAALDALRPELIARLGALDVLGAEGASFEAMGGDVVMRAGSLQLRVPEPVWLRLMFGHLASRDADDFDGLASPDRDLLKRLFPPVRNGLAGLDWF